MLSRTTWLWALLAVTAPCPVTLLLCNGLLPPMALAGWIGVGMASFIRNPFAEEGFVVAILAVEGAVMLWLLRWIARRVVERASPRAVRWTVAGLILISLTPIYFLDCMDGHQLTPCSVPMMIRAGLLEGRQCGDLGW
jgi:hypothetical protein